MCPMVKEPLLCPHCGARMESEDGFCAECGGARTPPQREKPISRKKPSPKKKSGPKPKSKPEPELELGPKADSKTILIVDDEINTLLVVQKVLEKEGYNVDLAATAEQGLSKLMNVQPDLVILDVKMPGMSGIEVCRRLREDPKGRGVRVIFLTVMEYTEEMKGELKTLNVNDYIAKPFKMRELLRSIKVAFS